MSDWADIQTTCSTLLIRLRAKQGPNDLKAAYLDLNVLLGRLRGSINEAIRVQGETAHLAAAKTRLDEVAAIVRQVGFDIRLASPAALRLGMETALVLAIDTLDAIHSRET